MPFGDLDEPDMAYVEHALGATHLVKEQDLLRARLVFDQLRSLALAPADSVAFIRRVAAELQTAEGDAVHENGLCWRTSSFSGVNGNSCVEVAPLPEGVAVRDTEDRARTPHLHSAAAWRSFVTAVRNREFDRP